MSTDNTYQLIISLPKSDGFHTHDDLHLANTVKKRVQQFLEEPSGIDGCTVRIARTPKEPK